HEVAPGETLYRISRQYEMSVAELQSLNNLRNTQLDIGQRLIVNASRPDVSAGRADTPPQPVHVDASAPMGTFAVHALGDHETVEGLLNSHRMDEEEFIRLNPQTDINDIKAGDEVYVLKPAASDKKNPYRVKSNLETAGDISVTVYDPQHQGNSTTSGDLYNPGNLTAAHSSLRLGKVIYIENPANGKGIFVQINDRVTGNFLKLSSSAFTALGYEGNEPLAARIYEELPE
ncbi:MAG: LysM peptidoglycan-binding domain-containing protein, partial [Balneolales bacterium]